MKNTQEVFADWQRDRFFLDALDLLRLLGQEVSKYEVYLEVGYLPKNIETEIEYLIYQHYDPNIKVETPVVPEPDTKSIPTAAAVSPTADPPQIEELKKRAIPLHKLQSHLHEQLRNATTDEERYEIAHRIMSEVIPAIDAIYEKIGHWKQTGDIPFVLSLEAEKAVEMMKRRETLKPRISRLKKWIQDPKVAETKKAEYRIELEEKEVELEQICKELNL